MQRYLLRNRNKIILSSALLIIAAFGAKWAGGSLVFFQGALIIASFLGGAPIAIQAYQALRVKVVSIEVLVTVAVTGAFILRNFEESALVTFLFLFGAFLEQRTLNKTRSAIRELTEMAPQSAWKLRADGDFAEVSVEEVEVGDVLLVKTGAQVPVDGRVLCGEGSVNEAGISGESLPVFKEKGSPVYAGTILDNGTLRITAEKVGEDTAFGKIIELVEEAQDSKSETERFIDRFSKYYTPGVLLIAFLAWLFSKDLELAITILVLGCPGALVIGVPVSHVAGIGNGARRGILLKGSNVISDFSRIDTMIFDKTGTLTLGKPTVAAWKAYGDAQEEARSYLASVEKQSDHPLAQAVLAAVGETDLFPVSQTEVIKGEGITALVEGKKVAVGSAALMQRVGIPFRPEMKADLARMEQNGNSLILTAVEGELKILLGVKDQLRPGIKEDLRKLKKLGVQNLIMLSGDNQGTVDLVSRELGLDGAWGNMLPEEKAAYVQKLIQKENQVVAFVGDGVNDSPSLALAQVGIAMGGGTDAAIETSDVVLINSNFSRLPHALGLSKAASRNMKQNVALALGVVLILLGGLLFGSWVNMSLGMLVHEGSILAVILNAMRLLRYDLGSS
ncbi:MAG: cadmium-translocating P-type ATPase [Firmicutes bacterium]|nr:cadmium-translocating P-type ATPase [Bacillota bacterium]